jgi:hypothetical protein
LSIKCPIFLYNACSQFMLLRHIHCTVSVDRVGRDADRNAREASVFAVSLIGTRPRRLCLVKLRNIKLKGRPFGGSAAVL